MNRILLAALLTVLAGTTWADDHNDQEIQYLLDYVAASGCIFHRNGSDHDSADAADHLRLKYSRGGKYVNNADQFIDRLASESSWTGKAYTVTCDGATEPSGDWLHRALAEYRNNKT